MLFPSPPPPLVSVTKNEHEMDCHGHFYWMAKDSEFFFGVCIYVLSNRKLKNYTNKVLTGLVWVSIYFSNNFLIAGTKGCWR